MSNYPAMSSLDREDAPWDAGDDTVMVEIVARKTVAARKIVKYEGYDEDGRHFEELDYDAMREEIQQEMPDWQIEEIYA